MNTGGYRGTKNIFCYIAGTLRQVLKGGHEYSSNSNCWVPVWIKVYMDSMCFMCIQCFTKLIHLKWVILLIFLGVRRFGEGEWRCFEKKKKIECKPACFLLWKDFSVLLFITRVIHVQCRKVRKLQRILSMILLPRDNH